MPMKTPLLVCLGAAVCLFGCGKSGDSTGQQQTNASGNPLTAPVDYLGALGQGKQYAEKTVDTVSINRGIQMFEVSEGRYPKDLNELVQKGYFPRIPEAPYGTKIVYDPTNGVVKVVRVPTPPPQQ